MKKSNKIHTKSPIRLAGFTEPVFAGITNLDANGDPITDTGSNNSNNSNSSSGSNGIGWVNAIGNAIGGLFDKFTPIADAIWGGSKSANITDESQKTTNFILIGAALVIVIVLILFLNKK